MTRLVAMCLASLLLTAVGCASSYEFSSPPPGHPANPNLATPVHERSMTLAEADSIDPRPAKSYQWAALHRESSEYQQHQMHQAKEESIPMTQGADHHQHQASEKRERKAEETQQAAPDNFESQLAQILQAYFETAEALAADDFKTATEKMELVLSRLKQADPKLLEEAKRAQWKQIYEAVIQATQQFLKAPVIEAARTAFAPISEQMEKAVRTFGSGDLAPVYRLHCPMALGSRGASWLQPRAQVNNPYYGESMLRCGSVTDTLATEASTMKKRNHNH